MRRPLRFVPTANALVEVTTRTIQGRLLLRPTPPINQAIVGVLGRGQKKYGMVVHCAVALAFTERCPAPQRVHELRELHHRQRSRPARRLDREVLGQPLPRDRRQRREGGPIGPTPVLPEEQREGESRRAPLEWPGVHSARALTEGGGHEGIWFDRTGYYRAKCSRKADANEPLPIHEFRLSGEIANLLSGRVFSRFPRNRQGSSVIMK